MQRGPSCQRAQDTFDTECRWRNAESSCGSLDYMCAVVAGVPAQSMSGLQEEELTSSICGCALSLVSTCAARSGIIFFGGCPPFLDGCDKGRHSCVRVHAGHSCDGTVAPSFISWVAGFLISELQSVRASTFPNFVALPCKIFELRWAAAFWHCLLHSLQLGTSSRKCSRRVPRLQQ